MGIKYLRGVFGGTEKSVKTSRPEGFKFPVGNFSTDNNSAFDTVSIDILAVGGGGSGGSIWNPPETPGSGGAGGFRLLSANSIDEFATVAPEGNYRVPILVGSGAGGHSSPGGSSCIGCLVSCGGGGGGWQNPGGNGGSGGGGGWGCGCGIAGQGCDGCGGGGGTGPAGGGAFAKGCTTGITTSFTGSSRTFSNGGPNTNNKSNATNCGGGGGNNRVGPIGDHPSGAGAPGLVAIRYCNNLSATTPLACGGNTVCCTGGCIIHIFTSGGFLNTCPIAEFLVG